MLSGELVSPSEAAPLEGSLGRYRMLDKLGAGGMGTVFAAYDPQLDRKVAIKLLRKALAPSAEFQARLLREAQLLAKLASPHVVTVHDAGVVNGQVFLAMELVEGQTLANWLTEKPRTLHEILDVFRQAAAGLCDAHAQQLVHRDFKPQNVLIGHDGRVRVSDFGLALDISPVGATADKPTIDGTPAYLAPELLRGQPPSFQSDQYAFCVSLRGALSNAQPLPAWLTRVLVRGLASEGGQRFADMRQLLGALRPPAPSRWLSRAGAVAALLAVGVPSALAYTRYREGLCSGAEQKLAAVWNEARAHALSQRFDELKASGRVRASTLQLLDAFKDMWARGYREACEATRRRGEQSEELLDRRMACLEDRRLELNAQVDQLLVSDRTALELGVVSTNRLSRVDDCADLAALIRPLELKDANSRAQLEALRGERAQLHVLFNAAMTSKVIPQAQELANKAKALGHPPFEADALLVLGVLQQQSGALPAASATLNQAFFKAQEGNDDALAVRIAASLVFHESAMRSRLELAELWLGNLEAINKRLPPSLSRTAFVEAAAGDLARVQGHTQGALAHYARAVEAIERDEGSSALTRARSLGNLAIAQRKAGQLAAGATTGQRALDLLRPIVDEGHPWVAEALMGLGNGQILQGNTVEARKSWRKAVELRETYQGADHPLTGTALLNLGTGFMAAGQWAEAEPILRRALRIHEATRPEHPNTAGAHAELGATLSALGQQTEGVGQLEQGLALIRKMVGEKHPQVVEILSKLGRAQGRDPKTHSQALESHRHAVELASALSDVPPSVRSLALKEQGLTQFELGRFAEAKASLEQVLTFSEQGEPDRLQMALTRLVLGLTLLEQGERIAGEQTLRRGLAEASTLEIEPMWLARAKAALQPAGKLDGRR